MVSYRYVLGDCLLIEKTNFSSENKINESHHGARFLVGGNYTATLKGKVQPRYLSVYVCLTAVVFMKKGAL